MVLELTALAPHDFFGSFLSMAALGIVPQEFAREIARADGLRNRLAHEYNGLDPRQVHGAAGRALGDVARYLDHLQQFLDRSQ